MHCDRRAVYALHPCKETQHVSHEHWLATFNFLEANSNHRLIRPAHTADLTARSIGPSFVDLAQHDLIEDHSTGIRVPRRHQGLDSQVA
jgi:hypothetical protein